MLGQRSVDTAVNGQSGGLSEPWRELDAAKKGDRLRWWKFEITVNLFNPSDFGAIRRSHLP